MAAHWLVSRGALRKVGGFSPAFRQYGEDDNYIDRLHWHGFSCGVGPAASAVHDRSGRSLPKEGRMRLKCVAPVVKLSNAGTDGHEREEPVGISAEADSRAAAALSGAHQAACGFEGGGGFPLISVRKFLNSLP